MSTTAADDGKSARLEKRIDELPAIGLPEALPAVIPLICAVGIQLPTMNILARDPEACILVLPSDHHVADESILDDAIFIVL